MSENPSQGTVEVKQSVLESIAANVLKEQRSSRRWRVFLRVALLVWLFLLLYWLFSSGDAVTAGSVRPHTALININGPIMADGSASAKNIDVALRKAFKAKGTRGVVLNINSPGGSAVQADRVYNQILALRQSHPKIKVYAVCNDVCASGAYFIAAAANDIYADRASIVGSIGVIMGGFGFVDAMHKLGVSRRLIKAGINKDFLDPFSAVRPMDRAHAQHMLDEVHTLFINSVKKGRGPRLHQTPDMFSGLVWTGQEARKLGLIDGFGDARFVALHLIGQKRIVDYTKKQNAFAQLFKGAGVSFGASFGHALVHTMTLAPHTIQ